MRIASIWPETACESHVRTSETGVRLTTNDIRNIINLALRKQTVGGRHQIGTLAGFIGMRSISTCLRMKSLRFDGLSFSRARDDGAVGQS